MSDGFAADELEVINELNRLFLRYLQCCAQEGGSCLGLPDELAAELGDLAPSALDRIAALPSALFRLDLARAGGTGECATLRDRSLEPMRLALVLTMLNSAWQMIHRRPFEARLFLKLSPPTIRCLRETPLSELPALADAPGVIGCAFPRCRLTWSTIMHGNDAETLRMMALITLQPEVETQPPFAAQRPGAGMRSVC